MLIAFVDVGAVATLTKAQTTTVGWAIAILITTVLATVLLEVQVRVSKSIDAGKKADPTQRAVSTGPFWQWNRITAHGEWIRIWRMLAIVLVIGSVVTIVAALLA